MGTSVSRDRPPEPRWCQKRRDRGQIRPRRRAGSHSVNNPIAVAAPFAARLDRPAGWGAYSTTL